MLAISIIALVISLAALPFTIWAARAAATQAEAARVQAKAAEDQTAIQREQVAAAREQTRLQRELAREALQPYVWADLQPDMQQGTVLHLVVGNSGPTTAHNVRVTFDPPLPATGQHGTKIAKVQEMLASGLRSLAPGREIRWTLGAGYELLASEDPQVCTVCVDAEGPNGPLPPLEAVIDPSQWRQARDAPDGSLHHVRGAIKDLTKIMTSVDRTLKRATALMPSQVPVDPEKIEVLDVEAIEDSSTRQLISPDMERDDRRRP